MSGIESAAQAEGSNVATVQTPAGEAPKPHVPASALPDDALKSRLEAAKATGRNELLRELGVTDPAQLKTALASIAAAEEARKTETEKFAELSTKEKQAQARLAVLDQAVASVWEAESVKLTPEQSKAVTDIAGDDVAMRVRTLNVLRATWATPPALAAQTPSATPQTLASTAPSAGAPAPTTTSQTNHKAHYEELQKTNPIQAARYLQSHEREIFPA